MSRHRYRVVSYVEARTPAEARRAAHLQGYRVEVRVGTRWVDVTDRVRGAEEAQR